MHFSSFMFRRGIVDFPEWSLDTINGDEVLLALHADWGPVGFIDKQLAAYRLHDAGIWSARSAIDHLTEALKTFDLIDKHFSGKYHDTIKIRQTRNAEFCLINAVENEGVMDAFSLLSAPAFRQPPLSAHRTRLKLKILGLKLREWRYS